MKTKANKTFLLFIIERPQFSGKDVARAASLIKDATVRHLFCAKKRQKQWRKSLAHALRAHYYRRAASRCCVVFVRTGSFLCRALLAALRCAALRSAHLAGVILLSACLRGAPQDAEPQVETLIGNDGLGRVCELSLDCPAGYHCDLRICARACREDSDCDGSEVCSPRGRCLGSGEQDHDPKPRVTPAVDLTGPDEAVTVGFGAKKLKFRIRSSSGERLRYHR